MPKPYQVLLNLLALSVLIFTGVDIFYRIVRAQLTQVETKPFVVQGVADIKGHRKSPLNDYRAITTRNIFGATATAKEEVKVEEIETLQPTSLKIALLGTVAGSQQNATAIIEETTKRRQGLYKVGDSVQNATIKIILRGKVVLNVDGRDEILTMEEAPSSAGGRGQRSSRRAETGTTITVSRSDIEDSMSNLNSLLSQVRIRPHFKDGKADGLSINRIRPGSIFSKLGLKDGDVVQGINGDAIKSPDDIMDLYKSLRSGSRVDVQISRRGRPKTLNYKFR